MTVMTPDMVRRFWSVVDEIAHPDMVLQTDADLTQSLLRACRQQHPLSNVDPSALNSYISPRLALIRDLVLG